MKSAVYIGDRTFAIEERSESEPLRDEVQLKIAFCGICGTDMHVYHGMMDKRVTTHRVIGHECSAIVDKIGANVTHVSVGDHVVVRPLVPQGDCHACSSGHEHICSNLKFLGLDSDGAFQEKWNVPATTLHKIPEGMKLAHAALVEPLAVACHDVTRSRLKKGEDVWVIGGGPIGLLIAMVCRDKGANVVISEVHDARAQLAMSLGFDVIHPHRDDCELEINKRTNHKGADVIFEVSGSADGVEAMTQCAAPRARIVMVAIHGEKRAVDLFSFFWRELELLGARVYTEVDYDNAIHLISSGKIDCDMLITDIVDLMNIQSAFDDIENAQNTIKSLIRCHPEGG
jgi:2-desacetyl-2-hydroxyethyl bacteriochlorophyllide A dehydrogenase